MIIVEKLIKTRRSGRGKTEVLSGVSLSARTGEMVMLAGKSGSGKTTLLGCIGGLERPDTGRVSLFGTELASLSPKGLSLLQRRSLGFVFQFGNLISYLTAEENIALPLALNGITGKARERRVEGLLESVGLRHAARAMPTELSGGEVQRIAVARAIAHRPALLLADEPTASLDTETGGELIRLMRSLAGEGNTTLIIATHDPELMGIADRVILLRDGKVDVSNTGPS